MSGRVLVVDDVATNRLLLRAKLSSAYYDVVVAENGTCTRAAFFSWNDAG